MTDGEGQYGSGESCRVKALRPLVLTTVQYEVETGFDFISVGEVEKSVNSKRFAEIALDALDASAAVWTTL